MIVILQGWADHRYVPNGNNYTFLSIMPRVTLTEVDYFSLGDRWDAEKKKPCDLSTARLECYINGESTNNDISQSNPIYIEFSLLLAE